MLNKLSIKTLTPYGVSQRRELYKLHSNYLFFIGFLIRLYLVFFVVPKIHLDWFLPFIENSLENIGLNPWDSFLENNGNQNAFPYGISMVAAYIPLTSLGELLGKIFSNDSFLGIGFRLTSFFFLIIYSY